MSDNIIHLNEADLKGELKNLVRNSVEKTLNELLNHELFYKFYPNTLGLDVNIVVSSKRLITYCL